MKKNILLTFFAIFAVTFAPTFVQAQTTPGCWDSGGMNTSGPMYPVPPVGQKCPDGTYLVSPSGYGGTNVNNNLSYTSLEPLSSSQSSGSTDFCQTLNFIFKALIYLGGMLAVLFLVLGGITYMVSEVVDKRSAARERIKAALWGLAILLASYIILNTVNPQLVKACNVLNPSGPGILSQAPSTAQDPFFAALDRCRNKGAIAQTATFGNGCSVVYRASVNARYCTVIYSQQDRGDAVCSSESVNPSELCQNARDEGGGKYSCPTQ
jgi:hypothetical protein